MKFSADQALNRVQFIGNKTALFCVEVKNIVKKSSLCQTLIKENPGLPPIVSMFEYTSVSHSGVPEVVRAFPACVNFEEFFSSVSQLCKSQQLPPDKLGAASRETMFKRNLEEEYFVQV